MQLSGSIFEPPPPLFTPESPRFPGLLNIRWPLQKKPDSTREAVESFDARRWDHPQRPGKRWWCGRWTRPAPCDGEELTLGNSGGTFEVLALSFLPAAALLMNLVGYSGQGSSCNVLLDSLLVCNPGVAWPHGVQGSRGFILSGFAHDTLHTSYRAPIGLPLLYC
jgi:hypothetical protein